MACALPEYYSTISPFNILLGTISGQLNRENVRRIKVQLRGHINKEVLGKLKGGFEVIKTLQDRGLVTEKKLCFLRKILQDCELLPLVELLDEYKLAVQGLNGKLKKGNTRAQISRRLYALKRLLKRQEEEIENCNDRRNELTKTLKDKEALLATQREISIIGEEAIDGMTQERDLIEEERLVVEEGVQEREEMFRVQEKELIDIKSAQGTKDKGMRKGSRADKRKTVFESVLDKQKPNRNVETYSKCYEEKQETLKRTKEAVDAMRAQLDQKTVPVRQFNKAILLKTKELVDVDSCILETMEDIRKVRQRLRQNELDLIDIRRETEETHEELTRSKVSGVENDAFKIPLWRLEGPESLKSKVISYTDVHEENSYVLGSLGMRIAPLQFDFPCSIASRNGLIYTADRSNCRVLIFDGLGEMAREPIDFGLTGPTAIAVNKKGNIIATDSQIIKVFSSDGLLSHNFLPVYSKNDTRPEISALTLDRDGNILAADRPNHRIQKFRIDGHFAGFIGGSMGLRYPSGVAVAKDNALVISECESNQLKILPDNGKSVEIVGRSGAGKDQFMYPRGLTVDNKGNILVADSLNHRIQVIDSQGSFIGRLGRLGSSPGCIDTPYAVAVNHRGHVLVADTGNHRVTIFT